MRAKITTRSRYGSEGVCERGDGAAKREGRSEKLFPRARAQHNQKVGARGTARAASRKRNRRRVGVGVGGLQRSHAAAAAADAEIVVVVVVVACSPTR